MHTHVQRTNLLLSTSHFWPCNILAWLMFGLAQSMIDALNGESIPINFLHLLPHTILGILFSFGAHRIYLQRQWHKQHPLSLTPLACLLAIIYASTTTLLNDFDLIIQLPDICTQTSRGAPNYTCGILSNCFTHNAFYMLTWAMLYILIQAERKPPRHTPISPADLIKAFISLTTLIVINQILSIIGWSSDDSYLFSTSYFLNEGVNFFTTCIIATVVLFIKPGTHILASRLVPLLPLLFILTVCSTILSIGVGASIERLINLKAPDNTSLWRLIYYIVFGSSYGHWNSKGMFAGQFQGNFTLILLISLFYIGCRFSLDWRPTPSHLSISVTFKKSLIFWSYAIGFWLFFSVLIYTSDIMDLATIGNSVPWVSTISFALFGTFIGAVLQSQISFLSAQKLTSTALSFRIFASSSVMGLLLTSTLWLVNFAYIFIVLDGLNIQTYTLFVRSEKYVLASILASCILCGLWSFICLMIKAQQVQYESSKKRLQIEMNMKEVQLNALAGKIDPHFIFNALNNIRALVDEDSEKARSSLVSLSDILRSPIAKSSQDKISITEEMLLVRSYIALSKIQFEEHLIYKEEVSDEVALALIPAMMLQIIVENAIKHGISQLPDGGILSLHIYKAGQELICTIANSGHLQLQSSTQGFGVGVMTIQERLRLLYDNNASFNLYENNGEVFANLVLPFESSI